MMNVHEYFVYIVKVKCIYKVKSFILFPATDERTTVQTTTPTTEDVSTQDISKFLNIEIERYSLLCNQRLSRKRFVSRKAMRYTEILFYCILIHFPASVFSFFFLDDFKQSRNAVKCNLFKAMRHRFFTPNKL